MSTLRNRASLGIRQRQMLDLMHRNGGVYPPHWRLPYDTRQLLDGLVERGWLHCEVFPSARRVYRVVS